MGITWLQLYGYRVRELEGYRRLEGKRFRDGECVNNTPTLVNGLGEVVGVEWLKIWLEETMRMSEIGFASGIGPRIGYRHVDRDS